MVHDFRNFPELANSQMALYYWDSPFKQITEDFDAEVIKVHDGDTITLRWFLRDFEFPLRLSNISAREMKETALRDTSSQLSADGKESQSWLENKILGETVHIKINPENRVEKFGRLLGQVEFMGLDVGEESIIAGMSVPWADRNQMSIPDFNKQLDVIHG